jgi:hypothetical protein
MAVLRAVLHSVLVCVRPYATSLCGLALLVYQAMSYWCVWPYGTNVYQALSY